MANTCKICGGPLQISGMVREIECEYCGNVIELDGERAKFANLYSKADDAWSRKDFDEAIKCYQEITEEDHMQHEAHWGIALCRYGIAYEIDPVTQKKMPTCNRINRESILDDKDYIAAIKYANESNRANYEQRAKEIDSISKEFLKIVDKEKPYDVFISYKKTDDVTKKLTIDRDYAMNLYVILKEKGFKVFFAEETLNSVAGVKYEPYIFAALTSAKVMVLFGSRKEYFEATWVKNEWRRFLALSKSNPEKKLIPAYIDCEPYEAIPQELLPLHFLDAKSIAFNAEIAENIKKIVGGTEEQLKAGKTLEERYAPKEKVDKIVNEIDCERDLAVEVLKQMHGKIDESIDFIRNDPEYKKKLWVCAECGAQNTHDHCHNPECGLSKKESIDVARKREEYKRRLEMESAEGKRQKAIKRKKRAKVIVTLIIIFAVLCGIGTVVLLNLNPVFGISLVDNTGLDAITYGTTINDLNLTIDISRLKGHENIAVNSNMVSGFDEKTLGEQTIVFSLYGKTYSVKANIVPKVLSAPTLSVSNGKLAVDYDTKSTEKVILDINGQEYDYSILANGYLPDSFTEENYTIKAKAVNSNSNIIDSEYSEPLNCKRYAPVTLEKISDNMLIFDGSAESDTYVIFIDGKETATYTNSGTKISYDIRNINNAGKHTISVAVRGTESNRLMSVKSDALSYTMLSVSATIDSAKLSWNAVEGATGYELTNSEKTVVLNVDTTEIDVINFYSETKSVTIKIRALGNGDNVIDSPYVSRGYSFEQSYITIRTVSDLLKLNGSNETFILLEDIDLSGQEWTPIQFGGTLIGNGHSIKNLTINSSSSNVGFFSVLSGTVSNLKFETANVTVTGRNENIGILAGKLTGTAVDITTSGSVTADKNSTYVGGVVGYVERVGSYTLSGLENTAAVSGGSYVGGIFGGIQNSTGSYGTKYSTEISGSNNSGSVTATGDYAGGILGYGYFKAYSGSTIYINSSANTGKIKGGVSLDIFTAIQPHRR